MFNVVSIGGGPNKGRLRSRFFEEHSNNFTYQGLLCNISIIYILFDNMLKYDVKLAKIYYKRMK
jgi:hypothetical protein